MVHREIAVGVRGGPRLQRQGSVAEIECELGLDQSIRTDHLLGCRRRIEILGYSFTKYGRLRAIACASIA